MPVLRHRTGPVLAVPVENCETSIQASSVECNETTTPASIHEQCPIKKQTTNSLIAEVRRAVQEVWREELYHG